MTKMFKINCYAATKQMDRDDNQDFFYSDDGAGLYIVADGMGGYKGGALASKFVSAVAGHIIKTMGTFVESSPDETIKPSATYFYGYNEILKRAFFEAHETTVAKARDAHTEGMGCTIVLLLFRDDGLYAMNAGDCRCYQYSEETLRQLTRDHSRVETMLRARKISKEEAHVHPERNIVERWVGGTKPSAMPDTYFVPYYINDRYILCTDGITKMLNDTKIEEFAKMENIKDAVNGMLSAVKDVPDEFREVVEIGDDGKAKKVKKKRKKDNATVMIVDVVDGENSAVDEETYKQL